jgi:hypothetical protein
MPIREIATLIAFARNDGDSDFVLSIN